MASRKAISISVGTVVVVGDGEHLKLLDQQPRAGTAGLETQAAGREIGPQPANADRLGRVVLDGHGPGGQNALAAELGLELAHKQVLKLVGLDARGVPDRVAPGGFPPGLPQTRTCAINAFGSSSYPFATPRYTEWIDRRYGTG